MNFGQIFPEVSKEIESYKQKTETGKKQPRATPRRIATKKTTPKTETLILIPVFNDNPDLQKFGETYIDAQLDILFKDTQSPNDLTTKQEQKQYRIRALETHPDKWPGNVQKAEEFKRVNWAHNFLGQTFEEKVTTICKAHRYFLDIEQITKQNEEYEKISRETDKDLRRFTVYTIITAIAVYNATKYILKKLEAKENDLDTIMQLDISDEEMEQLVKLRSSLRHTILPKWLKKKFKMQIDWSLAQVAS